MPPKWRTTPASMNTRAPSDRRRPSGCARFGRSGCRAPPRQAPALALARDRPAKVIEHRLHLPITIRLGRTDAPACPLEPAIAARMDGDRAVLGGPPAEALLERLDPGQAGARAEVQVPDPALARGLRSPLPGPRCSAPPHDGRGPSPRPSRAGRVSRAAAAPRRRPVPARAPATARHVRSPSPPRTDLHATAAAVPGLGVARAVPRRRPNASAPSLATATPARCALRTMLRFLAVSDPVQTASNPPLQVDRVGLMAADLPQLWRRAPAPPEISSAPQLSSASTQAPTCGAAGRRHAAGWESPRARGHPQSHRHPRPAAGASSRVEQEARSSRCNQPAGRELVRANGGFKCPARRGAMREAKWRSPLCECLLPFAVAEPGQ